MNLIILIFFIFWKKIFILVLQLFITTQISLIHDLGKEYLK
jgi:hypothetical protein